MVINVSVQYNGGFLPGILLLTQVPIFVWLVPWQYYIINTLSTIYYKKGLLFCHAWWLCMAVNISVHNGGLLSDIILLTQGYYDRGTRLNTM